MEFESDKYLKKAQNKYSWWKSTFCLEFPHEEIDRDEYLQLVLNDYKKQGRVKLPSLIRELVGRAPIMKLQHHNIKKKNKGIYENGELFVFFNIMLRFIMIMLFMEFGAFLGKGEGLAFFIIWCINTILVAYFLAKPFTTHTHSDGNLMINIHNSLARRYLTMDTDKKMKEINDKFQS